MVLTLLFVFYFLVSMSIMIFGALAKSKENQLLAQVLPMSLLMLFYFIALPIGGWLFPVDAETSFINSLVVTMYIGFWVVTSILILGVVGIIQARQQKDNNLALTVIVLALPFLTLLCAYFIAIAWGLVGAIVQVLIFLYIIGRKVVRKWTGRGSKEVEKKEEHPIEENHEPA